MLENKIFLNSLIASLFSFTKKKKFFEKKCRSHQGTMLLKFYLFTTWKCVTVFLRVKREYLPGFFVGNVEYGKGSDH